MNPARAAVAALTPGVISKKPELLQTELRFQVELPVNSLRGLENVTILPMNATKAFHNPAGLR
jgi:hypothetical protein